MVKQKAWTSTFNSQIFVHTNITKIAVLTILPVNDQLILESDVSPEGVYEEAKFFGLGDAVINQLKTMITEGEAGQADSKPLTRQDVISALITTSHSSELRYTAL